MRMNKCTFTASLAVAAFATGGAVVSNLYSRSLEKQSDTFKLKPVPDMQPPVYPSGITYDLIREGTFGAPRNIGERYDWVKLARGDQVVNQYKDPYQKTGGITLCVRAQKLYDEEHKKLPVSTEKTRFELAVSCAKRVRDQFTVLKKIEQNRLADTHVGGTQFVEGGSPFVSMTINNATAAVYAINPLTSFSHGPIGNVYLAMVNNATTAFPVVGGFVNGFEKPYHHSSSGKLVSKVSDEVSVYSEEVKITEGEVLVVGAVYFHDFITPRQAFGHDKGKSRTIPDLYNSGMSFQMFKPVKYNPQYRNMNHKLLHILPFVVDYLPNPKSRFFSQKMINDYIANFKQNGLLV